MTARPVKRADPSLRDGKRTERAKQTTRTRRQERRLKYNPNPRLEA